MSQTPDSPDGWIVPPPWLQAHDLGPEELAELKARFLAAVERGGPPVVMPPPARFRWWEWPLVQWWWYRQYKRADRRAFRGECDLIRWRAAWKDR